MAYLESIADIPKDNIVYIDETGIDTYLYRQHCYVERGQSIIGYVNGKKYRRIGIVAAKKGKAILAPLQYDGTMDSFLFETWFQECLLPILYANSVIVMDNAAFHRKSQLAILAKAQGHSIIFLPPYSPELNPIENFWAWLKAKLRSCIYDFFSFDDAVSYCFNVV